MISVSEAQRLVTANLPPARSEKIPFNRALTRVLSEDLVAKWDVPKFNRSAMDGFALRADDVTTVPTELEYTGLIRAGGGEPGCVRPGQAMAIMTGAPVPEGSDAVQIVEKTSRSQDGRRVAILAPVSAGQNIVPRGAEAAAGDLILETGRLIGPAEIAVLASFGCEKIRVRRRPRVAIFATGDELVEVGEEPRFDQIRNSNTHSISAQLSAMGIKPANLGIAKDDREELLMRLTRGLEFDILILTGGVSMGEYDLVKDVFAQLHLEIVFSGVAMRPGKPTVFARRGDTLVFGLPGNPVSTFVAFENFVRPAIGRMCGLAAFELPRVRGELQADLKQSTGRESYLPARVSMDVDGWKISPLPWKGSADVIAFSRCNATAILPADRDHFSKGETIQAMLLPDYFSRTR